MERLAGAAELLDGPLDVATLRKNLDDLERVNRWLGGAELSWRALEAALDGAPRSRMTLLDVGTGAADIPRHLLQRATRAGFALAIAATDVRAEIVDEARRRSAGVAAGLEISRARADGIDAPDESFDIVHASLVLHHLEPEGAKALLGEMARVSRRAVIVNDLDRAARWLAAAWLLSRVTTANRYTRHDAPLSVRRAYRPNEASALAAAAGLREVRRLSGGFGHRYALVLAAR
jgi:ubiquinone/menaquinone biosynthesis C-methylase UbiE